MQVKQDKKHTKIKHLIPLNKTFRRFLLNVETFEKTADR